ncbi:hypothetical protein ABIB51_004632 [Arthrobacter sp. UYCu712]
MTVYRSGVRWGFSDLVDGVAAAGRLSYGGLLDARHGKPSHCVAHSAPSNYAQEPAAVTPVQVEKPRVMTRLQKLVAEQQAKKAAEQAPVEKKPETDAQRQSRLMAERAQREQQRSASEDLQSPGLGL